MNKVKISILGSNYTISTQEEREYVEELALEIDELAKKLVEDSRVSAYDAMVLCALEYADRYRKSEQNADNLRSQLVGYLEDASRARIEVDESTREIEKLNREIAILREMTQQTDKE